MVDTTLKSRIDLRDLAEQRGIPLQGRPGAKERYGPCPKCKGKDRFHVRADKFFCRHCHPDRGDCIEFIMWLNGLDFKAACKVLSIDDGKPMLPPLPSKPTPTRQPVRLIPPVEAWQSCARTFVDRAQKLLWQTEGRPGLDYLRGRGFTDETIKAAGLGYNPKDINDEAARWGVSDRDSIWLPGPGIVIPWQIEGSFWRVNIRLLEPRIIKGKETKYIGPAGWAGANPLYNADALNARRPAILVEGELDALTVTQYAGDLITAVATGSTESARADRWVARLAACPLVLVAFDAEKDKGDKAAKEWLNLLPNARRWRPIWKDINEMARAGGDVRAWIEARLPAAPESKLDPATPWPVTIRWAANAPVAVIGEQWHRLEGGEVEASYLTPHDLQLCNELTELLREVERERTESTSTQSAQQGVLFEGSTTEMSYYRNS